METEAQRLRERVTTCGSACFLPRPTDPAGTPTPPAAGRGQSRPGRRSAAGADRACAGAADRPERRADCSGYACVAGRRLSLMGGGALWPDPRAPPCSADSPGFVPLGQLPQVRSPGHPAAAFWPSSRGPRTLHAAPRSAAPQDGERSESESIEAAAERRVIDGPLRRHHGTYAGALGQTNVLGREGPVEASVMPGRSLLLTGTAPVRRLPVFQAWSRGGAAPTPPLHPLVPTPRLGCPSKLEDSRPVNV